MRCTSDVLFQSPVLLTWKRFATSSTTIGAVEKIRIIKPPVRREEKDIKRKGNCEKNKRRSETERGKNDKKK